MEFETRSTPRPAGRQAARATSPPIVARRIDVTGTTLGFTAPPCPIHMKFFELPSGWTMVGLTAPGKPSIAARWLESFSPTSITIAPGLSPKVLRATFDVLPAPWQRLFSSVVVHYLELTPDGSASLFVEDAPEKVHRFLAGLHLTQPEARSRPSHVGPLRVKLTARQLEILSLAVALGYYEVPHKLNLRSLASKVGLSVGAVSELLRRGEALIVTSYIDALSEAEWKDDRNQATSPGSSPSS